MLRGLTIRNMLLIEALDLEFQPGLNVLTGETGAGKSILLDSLGFVLGWRGRADLVRHGAERGEVVAQFDLAPSHRAWAVLSEADIPVDDNTLILRRVNHPDGRKQAYVNDRRCGSELIRRLSDVLVELHSQFDDRGLLDERQHRRYLDEFGAYAAETMAVRDAWLAMEKLRARLSDLRTHHEAATADQDYLQHALDELTQLAPKLGEDAALDASRRLMQGAARIRADIAKAAEALGKGAAGQLADANAWLTGAQELAEGRLDDPLAALARARDDLEVTRQGVDDCLRALDFDPSDLDSTEERLFAIRALARKHNVQPDALADLGLELHAKLSAISAGEAELNAVQDALTKAQDHYRTAAAALSIKRQKTARGLDSAMAGELPTLKMQRALFNCVVSDANSGIHGADAVTFRIAPNPGVPAGPLKKIASGGELSRFLLALKVSLAKGADQLTMIFDEIDRGVGGATADAVGRRLVALSVGGQVLVVTHSPQVAALGDHHWFVEKTVKGEITTTDVWPLAKDGRVNEIARMLSGDVVTDEARAAAQVLLTTA